MKEQQSYYDTAWAERNKQGEQPDIDWAYDKRRIDATLLSSLKSYWDSSARILEIGVGKGDLASKISVQIEHKEMSYVGIDLSNEGAKIAQQRASKFGFLVADGTHLPFKSQLFDIVICSEVIEHITGKEKLLVEISRVLKVGGQLLMTTPNPKSLTYILPRMINKVKRFQYGYHKPVEEQIERKELADVLKRHGFEILSHTGLIFRPYTVGRLERRLKRPLIVVRKLSEYLERKNSFPGLALYQVIVARNKGTLSRGTS